MKFALGISLKNIKRKPFRSAAMAFLIMLLSFTLFLGALTVISLRSGLSAYQARLGADVIVTPASASGHGTVDDIFLQGITGNYYISRSDLEKTEKTEGIESTSRQFFLTSAKASCCSSRVQIIGFDPETDFSVLPWIEESYSGTISDGDVVVGADINMPVSRKIKFYGKEYNVAAQLGKTGTGLDNAVFANTETVRIMAENAADILSRDTFSGVDINRSASAVLIKVKPGYDPEAVADDINIHITKVKAKAARSMVSDISEGLDGISGIIGILVAVVWLLAIVIMITVFALLTNERKKEFAVLRVIGASKKMLFGIMGAETAVVSLIGSVSGLAAALLAVLPLSDMLHDTLSLPYLIPDAGIIALLCVCSVILPAAAGVFTASLSAVKITNGETGLLLREDA